MDREKRGIVPYLLFPFHLLCLVVLTIGCGLGCIGAGLFSKALSQDIGRLWCSLLLRITGVRIEVRGRDKIDPAGRYVFFANHQSALDIPVFYSALRRPLCFIAKKELFLIPIFGWGLAAMGHVKIDRSNARKARSSLLCAIGHLQRYRLSLILFPEGTRSVSGRLGEFRQGSFGLAIEAGVPVVPLAVRNANEVLPKKSLLVRPGTIYLDICDPITIGGMDKGKLAAVVRRAIEKVVET